MSKFEYIKNRFSKNQRALYEKIKLMIGDEPSVALISLQGESETSQAEIAVIAQIIKQFSPIEIVEHQDSPRKVILSGKRGLGHTVKISPQFKVQNEKPKTRAWSIDLLLELFRSVGEDKLRIAAVGIEYDGYPSHFIESGVKLAYKRDMNIASSEGIQVIRIAPDEWKKDPEYFIKHIKKYLDRRISDAEKLQRAVLKASNPKQLLKGGDNVVCPICNGCCVLAGEFCSICHGVGRVKASLAASVNIEDFETIDCNLCSSQNSTCKLCLGIGSVPLYRAIEYRLNEAG
ncbi:MULTISPECIES: hypothetical protein [Pseudomonas]|uniref:hypothetical protein n=1 Tax=Pseudomonas TaxID=286 RepID=UPI000A5F7605|nr:MULTISPECIES: hypothetical protein [Pseudomonas]WLP07922.1 hypothetical protein Q8015_11295 [Pseudomonas putida]